MPEHDLEPPRFARRALEKLLTNWSAVKSLFLGGCKEINKQIPLEEEEFFLLSQDGVTYLDRFTYALLVKCPSDLLDLLLSTLVKEVQNDYVDAQKIVLRFVRSVVRIFAVLNVAVAPSSSRKKRYFYIKKQVFQLAFIQFLVFQR